MAINPNLIDIKKVTELTSKLPILQAYFAHCEVNGVLYKATMDQLATFLAPYITAIGGSGFLATTGTNLPAASSGKFTIVGASPIVDGVPIPYTQDSGPNIITTEVLNILGSDSNEWGVLIGIPIPGLEYKADIINNDGKVVRASKVEDADVFTNIPATTDFGNASGFYNNGTGGGGNGGTVAPATNRKRMLFTIVDPNKDYVVSGIVIGGIRISLLVFFGESDQFLGHQYPVPDGQTQTITRAAITLPLGAVKIGTSTANNGVAIIEEVTRVVQYDTPLFLSNGYNKDQTNDLLSQKASEINNDGKVVRAEEKTNTTYTPIDGQDPTTGGPVVTGSGFFNRNTGAITASTTRKVALYPINPSLYGYDITTNMSATNTQALVVYFDQNKVQLKNGQGAAENGLSYEQPFSASGDVDFVGFILNPPAEARYIGATNQNTRPIIVRRIETVASYEKAVFEDSPILNPLSGKVIWGLGDSIVKANEVGNYGIMELLSVKYNMTLFNRAVGGATMAVVSGSNNNIPSQIDNAISVGITTPDIILFDGMTNDIGGSSTIQLGEISTSYVGANFDKATFTGAAEYVIWKARTAFLNVKLVYYRVHNMSSRNAAKQIQFGNRIVEVCNKWGVPIIDAFNRGQLNTNIVEMRNTFTVNADGTHPNRLAYELFVLPLSEEVVKSV